jgi:hypothetical protein
VRHVVPQNKREKVRERVASIGRKVCPPTLLNFAMCGRRERHTCMSECRCGCVHAYMHACSCAKHEHACVAWHALRECVCRNRQNPGGVRPLCQAGLYAKKEKKGVYLTGRASSWVARSRCSCSGFQVVRRHGVQINEGVGLKEGWMESPSTSPAKVIKCS